MSEISLKFTNYCPLIQIVVLVIGTLLCFAVAYAKGDVSLYLPFISETGAYSPEKCLFSLSLILGSFFGIISYFIFFVTTSQSPLNEERLFFCLNKISLFIGIGSMIGLAGVAAFPMTTVFWAHLLFAALYFLGSAIYFILLSIITYKIEGRSKKFILRSSLTIAILIFLFFLVIFFPQSLVRWHKFNSSIPALKTPEKQGFTLLLISSFLEWAIVIVIVIFTLSLYTELKKHSLQITITEAAKSTSAAVEGPPDAQQ